MFLWNYRTHDSGESLFIELDPPTTIKEVTVSETSGGAIHLKPQTILSSYTSTNSFSKCNGNKKDTADRPNSRSVLATTKEEVQIVEDSYSSKVNT